VADQVAKQMKLSTDKALLDRVNTIGQKIAAVANVTQVTAQFGNDRVYPFTWTFHVVEDKDVNAFSLPGGYIYVNSGLLSFVRSDDELAAVLGHEITHAAHHHASQIAHQANKMNTEWIVAMIAAGLAHVNPGDIANAGATAQLAQQGVLNNHYSENAERDADHGGLIFMQKAGYDPAGMLTFMERLHDMEGRSVKINMGILQDHPYTDERLELIQAQLKGMGITVTPADIVRVTRPDRFAAKLDGTVATLTLGDQVCAKLSDPRGSRASALADALNAQMLKGLEGYQIDASGSNLLLSGQTVLTLTADDAVLADVATPADAARALEKGIQRAVYIASFPKPIPSVQANEDGKKGDKEKKLTVK
jgi:predicted Zn-dependent protease